MIITDQETLKQPCSEVESFKEALEIIDKLDYELTNSQIDGIGLAANQIGINKKVCILRIPADDQEANTNYTLGHNLVNPKIISRKTPFIMKNEGCLSFPNEALETLRYKSVFITDFLQPEGRLFTGLAAVVALHECDHLEGLTFHDRILSNLKPNMPCICESQKQFKHCCAITMRNNTLH